MRFRVGLLAGIMLIVGSLQSWAEGDKSATPASVDAAIYESLKVVINTGADLYNAGDWAGCFRLYQGALLAVRDLLAHKPELQKMIRDRLAAVKDEPLQWRRAFTLREVLDRIREETNPRKSMAKSVEKKAEKPQTEPKPTTKSEPLPPPHPAPPKPKSSKPVPTPIPPTPKDTPAPAKKPKDEEEVQRLKTPPQIDPEAKPSPDDEE
jgi:hypothetical protein